MTQGKALTTARVEPLIHVIRGQRVILDADLARIYGVQTKVLNQAVRRNATRFPEDFAFLLTRQEVMQNRSQSVTGSQRHRDPRSRPMAFTEHGAIMAATVLSSPRAIEMSIFVVRAFARMREELATRYGMDKRLDQIEKVLLVHDDKLRELFEKIRPLLLPPPDEPKKPIGFTIRESRARYRIPRRCRPGLRPGGISQRNP